MYKKKLISFFLAVTMAIGITACTSSGDLEGRERTTTKSQTKTKKDEKKETKTENKAESKKETKLSNTDSEQKDEKKEEKQDKEKQNTEKTESKVSTASNYSNMSLGDIGKSGDIYVGLSYVKKMSYLPVALGQKEDISSDNEVILAFFDFYNDSNNSCQVNPDDITCYADGIQVEGVDNCFKVECDGIKQYYWEDIAGKTQMASVQDFEVPKGWKELKFFYDSKCIWTINEDDVKTDNYNFVSMYENLEVSRNITEEGAVIYDDNYEITFQGVSDYSYNNYISGNTPYTIFKFSVKNTGSSPIDYELAGYEMTAYIDNYYAGTADYMVDEKIDGYSNIYNIDKIEAGMSANIYVAFEGSSKGKTAYMIFDDGYISNTVRGKVYVER